VGILAGASSIGFSGGTVAGSGTCTLSVNVTAAITGSYPNTSNHLFIDTIDYYRAA
jgi:hypothetical protein